MHIAWKMFFDTHATTADVLHKLSEPVRDVAGTPSWVVLGFQASPKLSSPYTCSYIYEDDPHRCVSYRWGYNRPNTLSDPPTPRHNRCSNKAGTCSLHRDSEGLERLSNIHLRPVWPIGVSGSDKQNQTSKFISTDRPRTGVNSFHKCAQV